MRRYIRASNWAGSDWPDLHQKIHTDLLHTDLPHTVLLDTKLFQTELFHTELLQTILAKGWLMSFGLVDDLFTNFPIMLVKWYIRD